MEALSAEKIRRFLERGYGYGSGAGFGYGSGDGSGYAFICFGAKFGSGDDSGDGAGYGFGPSEGCGCETGAGFGFEYSYGCDSDIKEIDGMEVHRIDGIDTVLHVIHNSVAKGAILKDDMTFRPCYVVKGQGQFAHGETLRSAMEALQDKIMEEMPVKERLNAFVEKHPEYNKPYPNRDLYDWHHKLTGSCEMGRDEFVKSHGLSLEGETTVEEFVRITEKAYGGSVIRQLPEAYGITGGVRDERS